MPDVADYETEDEWMSACVPARVGEGNEQKQAVAACLSIWRERDQGEPMHHFLWVDLGETPAPPYEFLRTGAFVDLHGRDVMVTEETLDALAAHFSAGAAGQDVPIDVDHEKGKAGGWVKRVWRDGSKLLADIEWNEIGQQLVGGRVYRYLSASFDTARNVLKSISLVNFPSVKGLAPVELSEGAYTMTVQAGLLNRVFAAIQGVWPGFAADDTSAQESAQTLQEAPMIEQKEVSPTIEEIREKVRAEMQAELAEQETKLAELRANVRQELEAEMAERVARHDRIAELAEGLCSGEHALSTPKADVVSVLESLTDEQVEAIVPILKAKIVDFSEHGSDRDSKAKGKQQLPAEFAEALRRGDLKLADLETDAAGLGDLSEYDLTEFQAKEN